VGGWQFSIAIGVARGDKQNRVYIPLWLGRTHVMS
jgi:hypothetical protein